MICEMCGREMAHLKRVSVEGSLLMVCEACARFGKEVSPAPAPRPVLGAAPEVAVRLEARRRRMTPRDIYEQQGEEDLLPNFGDIIRKSREGKGWKREDLGKKINERVSIIEKLEKGQMRPPDELLKRLERALGVKLRGKVQPTLPRRSQGSTPLTLGDLIRPED